MPGILHSVLSIAALALLSWSGLSGAEPARNPAVVVIGSVDTSIEFWKARDFWGAEEHGNDLAVPRAITVVINKGWKQEANQLPVADKKELFYRTLLPLILYSNELILRDRHELQSITERLTGNPELTPEERTWLHALALRYRLIKEDSNAADELEAASTPKLVADLMSRVDIIPPSLALGQGAYESGYGTSRFSLEGNALFGQWTWGSKGIKPLRHRSSKGDYKVAAYDWPLDSVRAYMLNLNTQRTYADLRKQRAHIRQQQEPLSGLDLTNGLLKYSEKGLEYVKTLQGIIRVNQLDIADSAQLRDEPITLIVSIDTEDEATTLSKDIERMQNSDELDGVVREMALDGN
jgi:Bax protein